MMGLIPIITAVLGAYAGKEGTSLFWRRFGIPLLLSAYACWVKNSFTGLWLMFLWPILSIGYGIPDETDEGSTLGRFFKRHFKYPSSALRGFIAVLMALCFLPLVGDGVRWTIGSIVLILVWMCFGGDDVVKGEGEIAGLLVEDLILYGTLGAYAVWLVR